ncbi:MAG: RICIN domain-containing protein, partial [Eubacterium sp.]|nr:RICIN domain-containing protein [Eubacterium sp.]
MKKVSSVILSLAMLLSVTTGTVNTVYAASNPYDYYAKDGGGNWANCTWWAWQLAYDNTGVALPKWGNAGTWYNSAPNAGYSCGTTPAVNSIAVKNGGGYGHVQFVTAVNGSQIYVKEGGYRGTTNGYHEGWTSTSGIIGYIYLESTNQSGSPIGGGSQTVSDGEYHIVSALNKNMGLDAENGGSENGTNICLYNNIGDSTQTFNVKYLGDGFYSIVHKKSQKSLDVDNAGTAYRTNVKLYTSYGSDAQKWVIQTSGDGYFYIKSKCNGLCIDVDNASATNKANIQMYGENGTNAQKWAFIASGGTQSVPDGDYHIVPALNNNYGLDVYNCDNKDGTNVQLFNNINDSNQVFNVRYNGNGYYTLTHKKTNKVLDMYNGGTYFGTNINIYSSNNTDAQRWLIKSDEKGYYYIIAKNSGLFVDVKSGEVKNGTNIWGYIGNKTDS